ncbi:aggrecan core protein [Nematostella vectensis]|uniref:aggrecan core protein n=1 Tax=Nematostella vectensis TaxID=45351 RepID=UPI0020776695|nr:aggrecan core protein [Nematostella vectensis]XP_048579862.1 aggrecan core protein [Nematostella vectensis]
MRPLFVLVFANVLLLLFRCYNSEYQVINFMGINNTALVGYIIDVFHAKDVMSCKFRCAAFHSCKSVNVGKKERNDTLFTCEINNSTHLEQKFALRHRARFAYHGLADPCFSSPCLNGGTCTADYSSWSYRCNCGLEIRVVPFLNANCAVDPDLVRDYKGKGTYNKVFYLSGWEKRLLNFTEAERMCQFRHGHMASREQLTEAWKTGYHLCRWGWLTDVSGGYPIQTPTSNCGGADGVPRVESWSVNGDITFDAFCYRQTDDCNEENWVQNGRSCYRFFLDLQVRWAEASRVCHMHDAGLGIFKSPEKLLFVRHHVTESKPSVDSLLVGLKEVDSSWEWLDGGSVNPNLWNITAPGAQGPLGAVAMETGRLVDVPDADTFQLPFVCEKSLPYLNTNKWPMALEP